MSSPLQQLHADLLYAAQHGGEVAGEAAVHAGVDHADSAPRALANVESVHTSFAGPMQAHVEASQPAGITPGGPRLPSSESIADVMADTAAKVGQSFVNGKR